MSVEDRRRATYVAAYAERFGGVPRRIPEFVRDADVQSEAE